MIMMLNFNRLNHITNADEWKQVYDEEIHKLDELYQEEERLYYKMYAEGIESERINEIQRIRHELMTDEAIIQTLSSWKDSLREDPIWHRRLHVSLSRMRQEVLESHPELTKIQQRLQANLMNSTFMADGKEYYLGTVHSNLLENPDRELRRKLFHGAQKIGEKNEDLFRALVNKRNELAGNLGYSDYYHFKCSLKEVDMDSYMEEMNALLERTKTVSTQWEKRIKEKFGWETLHYYDQYFSTFHFHQIQNDSFHSNRMKEVLGDVVSSLGKSIDEMPISIESLDIPYGGFCLNINPNDLKLVVSKRDSYSVFLSGIHELGHAIDGHYASYRYPELYRFYSSIAAEGMAELFQTIITDQAFLMKNFDLHEDNYVQMNELQQLMDLKMMKINHYFSLVEYELYQHPDRSFQEIANDCYTFVFGYEGETGHPANMMFYVENPAFFQDYNIALAMRDMIRHKFKIKSPYGKKDVFHEIQTKFIVPNQLYSWKQRVETLCGESHTFAYLAERLSEE
jgi:oligoendopeptidase F